MLTSILLLMRRSIAETFPIPEGVSCTYTEGTFHCAKGGNKLSRVIKVPQITLEIKDKNITLAARAGGKKELTCIMSQKAHINNLFRGLAEEFVYHLEACNVHFPMTLKVEGDTLLINNFLGEKTPRKAHIVPGVKVDLKGPKVTLTGRNIEALGHTMANIERATKVRNRDRRVFQDGIFLTERPGGIAA